MDDQIFMYVSVYKYTHIMNEERKGLSLNVCQKAHISVLVYCEFILILLTSFARDQNTLTEMNTAFEGHIN